MESYENERSGVAMPDGMRRTVIPGLKREKYHAAEPEAEPAAQVAKPEVDAETRRFTPSPLQQQALRSIRLPQTDTQPVRTQDPNRVAPAAANQAPAAQTTERQLTGHKLAQTLPREAVTGRELFARVPDQDTMRRLATQAGNDLDEELANNQQWRDNLADLAQKQPLNPQVSLHEPQTDGLNDNDLELPTDQLTEQATAASADPAAQALAKAREDAFRMWEAQTASQHREAFKQAPAYQAERGYQLPTDVQPAATGYQDSLYAPDDSLGRENLAASDERFQAYDSLMANPDQAAYAYQAYKNQDYAAGQDYNATQNYAPQGYAAPQAYQADSSDYTADAYVPAAPSAQSAGQDYAAESNYSAAPAYATNQDYAAAPNYAAAPAYAANQDYDPTSAAYAQPEIKRPAQELPNPAAAAQPATLNKYDAALANDTGLVGSLLTSGHDLVSLLQTMFTNFPEEACKQISQAKSMAFVPVSIIYFVLQLIYGSANLTQGGLLTTALTGKEGLSIWAAMLVTILTAVLQISLYTLIFVLANYLSYHKRPLMSTLNCVAALLLLKACFIPLYLIFNIFATQVVGILETLCFVWTILLVDKLVRQQGSPRFSKQADLVALIIASLTALLPALLAILL